MNISFSSNIFWVPSILRKWHFATTMWLIIWFIWHKISCSLKFVGFIKVKSVVGSYQFDENGVEGEIDMIKVLGGILFDILKNRSRTFEDHQFGRWWFGEVPLRFADTNYINVGDGLETKCWRPNELTRIRGCRKDQKVLTDALKSFI